MRFAVKFRGLSHSSALVGYVEERFEKLKKFEIKPIKVQVTFYEEGHNKKAEVFIHGLNKNFRAEAFSDSYYVAIDMCLKKVWRQMEKEKAKIKKHRNFEASDEAQLQILAKIEERGRRAA